MVHRVGLRLRTIRPTGRGMFHSPKLTKEIEKVNKSMKQLAYDTIEAHQETITDLRNQLAKANERVKELEKELEGLSHESTQDIQRWKLRAEKAKEQLRKEQECEQ